MKTLSGKKIVRVPYTIALEVLAPIHFGPPRLNPPLPPGTAVLSVHENHVARSLDFTIQNDDFEAFEPGMMLPIVVGEWARPGGLLLLRNDDENKLAQPNRIAVLLRSSLEEIAAIHTPGVGGVCVVKFKDGASSVTVGEIEELARHVRMFNLHASDLEAAKKRIEAREAEAPKIDGKEGAP